MGAGQGDGLRDITAEKVLLKTELPLRLDPVRSQRIVALIHEELGHWPVLATIAAHFDRLELAVDIPAHAVDDDRAIAKLAATHIATKTLFEVNAGRGVVPKAGTPAPAPAKPVASVTGFDLTGVMSGLASVTSRSGAFKEAAHYHTICKSLERKTAWTPEDKKLADDLVQLERVHKASPDLYAFGLKLRRWAETATAVEEAASILLAFRNLLGAMEKLEQDDYGGAFVAFVNFGVKVVKGAVKLAGTLQNDPAFKDHLKGNVGAALLALEVFAASYEAIEAIGNGEWTLAVEKLTTVVSKSLEALNKLKGKKDLPGLPGIVTVNLEAAIAVARFISAWENDAPFPEFRDACLDIAASIGEAFVYNIAYAVTLNDPFASFCRTIVKVFRAAGELVNKLLEAWHEYLRAPGEAMGSWALQHQPRFLELHNAGCFKAGSIVAFRAAARHVGKFKNKALSAAEVFPELYEKYRHYESYVDRAVELSSELIYMGQSLREATPLQGKTINEDIDAHWKANEALINWTFEMSGRLWDARLFPMA